MNVYTYAWGMILFVIMQCLASLVEDTDISREVVGNALTLPDQIWVRCGHLPSHLSCTENATALGFGSLTLQGDIPQSFC